MSKPILAMACAAALLTGCAGMNTLQSDVSSYTSWPPERKPGTYAFERLPSQQAQAESQEKLEAAARDALTAAGFTEAAPGSTPDNTVQVGLRLTRYYERSPWADPFWGPGFGWGWGPRRSWWSVGTTYDLTPRYDREVSVLIRDQGSGKVLYESRAQSDGSYSGDQAVLMALYQAALKDFPQPAVSPRRVTVPLPEH